MKSIGQMIQAIGKALDKQGEDSELFAPLGIDYFDDQIFFLIIDLCGSSQYKKWWVGYESAASGVGGVVVRLANEDEVEDLEERRQSAPLY